MKEIAIKKSIRFLFGISIVIFILNKFYLRPYVIQHNFPELIQIFVFSIPNLIEATIGTLILTGILFQLRQSFPKSFGKISDSTIYFIATLLASIYVLSQELKWHNLGGNNVYDMNDLMASVIGLTGTFFLLKSFGFLRENPHQQ